MKSAMRGAIVTSLIIQGIGSFAPFFTIILLARLSGPTTQGIFSTFKTWADLVSSLIVFGFPQAFVYLINKKMATRAHLLNISLLYVAVTTLFVIPIAIHSVLSSYNQLPDERMLAIYAVLLAFGVGAFVLNRLVRAIYLTIDDGFLFSLITSAPAFFTLVAMVIAARLTPFSYDIAFFVAGVLTCLATGIWIKRIIAAAPGYTFALPAMPRKALAQQSIHTFLQSISFTLQPVVTIYLLVHFGANIVDVAAFTAATIVIAAVNVFFGIVAPIFFNRWSAGMSGDLFRRIRRIADMIALFFIIVGFAAIPLYSVVVPFVFGPAYEPAVTAFQIISLAVAPVAFTRIIASAIHAADRPDINSVSCGVRLVLSVALQFCLSNFGAVDPVIAAVWAWVGAEWAAAAYSWHQRRKMLMEARWQ